MAALNPRQLKFVELYLATGNATQSYIDAGYTADPEAARRNASRLLTNADVARAVETARESANAVHGITAAWYALRVKLEAEREGDGSSHSARVSALKLAGDLLGIGELHKHQHSGPGFGPVPLANLTDDELDRRIAELETRALAAARAPGLPDVPAPLPAPPEMGLAAPLVVSAATPAGDEPRD